VNHNGIDSGRVLMLLAELCISIFIASVIFIMIKEVIASLQ
jgi:hypothetical protein